MERSAQEADAHEAVPRQGRMSLGCWFRTSRKEKADGSRTLRWLPATVLLVIGSCFLIGVRLFLHPPPEPQTQAVTPEKVPDPVVPPLPAPITITLGKNKTITEVLLAQGIPQNTVTQIVQALRSHLNLRRLQPDDTLLLHRNLEGAVTKVVYCQSPVEIFEVLHDGRGWIAYQRDVAIDRRVTFVAGAIEETLFDSIERLGESPQLVLDFAEIFAWDFDFASDSQPGDQFRMLVEKSYVADQFVEYGRILAAEYESEGEVHTAIYFVENSHGDYYTPGGESLRRAFLKSPLDFTRISSGYNRARRHPVLGGVRPHLAVDYAAPVGTPVRAVADGVVTFAGRKGGYGNMVILRHRANYETVYSHLSRFGKGIRSGARVAQRHVIGYVGSTGLSTGPHLDYRVIKDGRFVNPLKQTFLPGKPVSPSSRPSFISTRDIYLQKLRGGIEAQTLSSGAKGQF
jgi:murein DD-endopeptidase MepM/ murein hydrolase activator NlpD